MNRHFTIIILISLLLVGCSHNQKTASANDDSIRETENEQDHSLLSAYFAAMETYKTTIKEQDASFSYADYYTIRDSFNIVAYAAGSDAVIQSPDDIVPMTEMLRKDLEAMTEEDTKAASQSLHTTGQPLYQAAISRNLHELVEKVRFPSEKNKLQSFLSNNENQSSKHMLTQSDITISSIKEDEYAQLHQVEKLLATYPNHLTKSDTNSILFITKKLRASLDMQVNTLINYATTNTPESMDKKINTFVGDFNKAELKLEELDEAMEAEKKIPNSI
ncbi:hypothetical protein [Terribacillus saccharophilus]|uniref:hypothetical protein n=1 Tax=Terribacillus saccharophilus TaxID=361277 RepID=UPI000C9CAE1F|nr:hypothetical protein [Terribacillus goriensis]